MACSALLAAIGCGGDEPACAGGACADATAETTADAATAAPAFNACASQTTRAMRAPVKPLDVIFVIDNSGSMTEEIAAVRRNINDNFAALIQQSGADYRVIVLSLFGTQGNAVCIEPPLAGSDCAAGLAANDSPVFFHYNAEIGSNDAFCRILATFDQPDAELRAPRGWQQLLRPDSQKAFVLITDDSAACVYDSGDLHVQFGGEDSDPYADALMFHEALLAKSPEQFGVPPDVRYQFYGFVGMRPSEPANQPWFPHEPLQSEICDTAPSPGLSYQALSVVTDALRYPVCEGRGFDAVFRVLAQNVVESTKAACVFELPAPPEGEQINQYNIVLEYRPGGGGEAQHFMRAADLDHCDAHGFVVSDDRVTLCRQACDVVEADSAAQIDVQYACRYIPE
jgi:hypothetical protein